MELSLDCFKDKEVVVSCSGKKLGFPKDIIIDCECGKIVALILCRSGFSFLRGGELRISWCDVERIGEDVIWVCREPPNC